MKRGPTRHDTIDFIRIAHSILLFTNAWNKSDANLDLQKQDQNVPNKFGFVFSFSPSVETEKERMMMMIGLRFGGTKRFSMSMFFYLFATHSIFGSNCGDKPILISNTMKEKT